MPRVFDLLVGLGEALCPPFKRRSRMGHAAVGRLAVALVAAVLVWLVVRVGAAVGCGCTATSLRARRLHDTIGW
jgi:hypothetical protein